MSRRSGLALLAALALLAGCGEERGDPPFATEAATPGADAPFATEPAAAARTAAIEARIVEESEGDCSPTAPEDAVCTTVHLEVPAITDLSPATRDAVARFFDQWLGREDELAAEAKAVDLAAFAKAFIADYREFRAETPDYVVPWSLERRGELVHRDERVVSVAVSEYAYLGGAHGNSLKAFASFDAESGARLELGDCLRDPEGEAVSRAAEAVFRTQAGVPAGQSLEDAGYWFEAGFQLTDNFAVVEDGLLFYYNPYEIAPYAMGPTELRLRKRDLGDLVRAGGPLASR